MIRVSFFTSEMIAIDEAIRYACDIYKGKSINILSDLRSSLTALISYKENKKFILGIRNRILENKNICLYWTKVCIGSLGNKRGDVQAKEATKQNEVDRCFHLMNTQLRKI